MPTALRRHPRLPRYTALTGSPPFPETPLSELYQNIRAARYPEPAHLSPSARQLIARLLAPNPAERPTLDQLLQDAFFTQVGCPSLPAAWVPFCPAEQMMGSWSHRAGADPKYLFRKGFTPERLPPHSCHSPPNFAVPPSLDGLLRKVGRLLLAECRLPRK